jgi:hypothetical protein
MSLKISSYVSPGQDSSPWTIYITIKNPNITTLFQESSFKQRNLMLNLGFKCELYVHLTCLMHIMCNVDIYMPIWWKSINNLNLK